MDRGALAIDEALDYAVQIAAGGYHGVVVTSVGRVLTIGGGPAQSDYHGYVDETGAGAATPMVRGGVAAGEYEEYDEYEYEEDEYDGDDGLYT